MKTDDIREYIDNGDTVAVSVSHFDLYNPDGTKYNDKLIEGGHMMVITDITKNGDYVVSTWGERLVLRHQDFDCINNYIAVDINAEEN